MNPLEQYSDLLQEFAQLLYREAAATDPNWSEAYYDFRLGSSASGLDRLVVRTPTSRIGCVPSPELTQVCDCLWQLRDEIPGGGWFGLFVHIDSNGEVDVKYDHNPKCIETFADDVKAKRPF